MSTELSALVTELQTLKPAVDSLSAGLEQVKKNQEEARNQRAPWARRGEDPFTSRGFQFSRVVGVMTGKLDKNMAKVEGDLTRRVQQEYVERGHFQKHEANSIVVPLSSQLMAQADPTMEKFASEVGEEVAAGVAGYDREHAARIMARRFNGSVTRALSWMDESGLGALVGPPVVGEPIELLRNQEVFMKAGARVIPFPASGRVVWPRFTGATTAYWVGSSTAGRSITASEPTTGDVVLQVKKLGVRVTIPNELFRFPTASVEQLVRADMMKSASLKMDGAFFWGVGSATEPKGLINYDNVLDYTASVGTIGANGNTFEPEDVLKFIGTVEEQNLDFKCWVMRSLMYAALGNRRADAAAPGDRKGAFLFNMLRSQNERTADVTQESVGALEGYPVYKSNQILNTRSKGSATNLTTIWGGDFSQYLIAMSGVMEFLVATQGDTIFPQDQSDIRMITWVDGAPRYEKAFIKADSLVVG